MSDRPNMCPGCNSRYHDVRGQIFPVGNVAGYRCEHPWHCNNGCDPSVLNLTEADKKFLSDQRIAF